MAAPEQTLKSQTKSRNKPQYQNTNGTEEDPKKRMRERVNQLLPDGLMIVLAVLMAPIVVIPFFIDLSDTVYGVFEFVDYTILAIFALEYILKTVLAKDIWKHVTNSWHILDLIVIVIPLFDFLQLFGGFGHWSPVLRLLRITRLVAVGGRTVQKIKQRSVVIEESTEKPPVQIKVVENSLDDIEENIHISQINKYLNSPSHTWIDISSVSDTDFDELSNELGIPRLVLESELVEESYPRIDYFEHYSMIFTRIANVNLLEKGAKRLSVNRVGILVVCCRQNIIIISKSSSNAFNAILEKARKYHNPAEPLVVSVLYAVMKHILETDHHIITALEQELMKLESIPLSERPSDFLETTFHLKKEVNQLVPSLLHMKEIATMITSRQVTLEGFTEKHERLFDILTDEATYLQETGENARENLLSLIDLYINTTSFELNKVMRIIAVISCLGIIPAVGGLFGSNLIGNPWDFQLWQLMGILGMVMLIMLWIFYRMGWLKI